MPFSSIWHYKNSECHFQILSCFRGNEVFKRHRPKCSQMLYFVVFGHQDPSEMRDVKVGQQSSSGSKNAPLPGKNAMLTNGTCFVRPRVYGGGCGECVCVCMYGCGKCSFRGRNAQYVGASTCKNSQQEGHDNSTKKQRTLFSSSLQRATNMQQKDHKKL